MQDTFVVERKDADKRLDVYLAGKLKGVSRTQIKKVAEAGQVLVNGKAATPHLALSAGDTVTLSAIAPRPEFPPAPTPRPDIPLAVVYEDADIVVVDKPTGLLVHPTVRSETETLAGALIARYPEMTGVGEAPDRPGIMHRLDKEASGLLVVAKTQKAYESLKRQFKRHDIKKEYVVLVHGAPPKDEGTVSLSIGRAKGGGRMAARHQAEEGDRAAVTHYRVEERFAQASLLTVRTETGRTHQIRAHFKALGCPVAGDPLYKIRSVTVLPVRRLFLHAAKLGFTKPGTRKKIEFAATLPADLEEALAVLRGRAKT